MDNFFPIYSTLTMSEPNIKLNLVAILYIRKYLFFKKE